MKALGIFISISIYLTLIVVPVIIATFGIPNNVFESIVLVISAILQGIVAIHSSMTFYKWFKSNLK